MERWRRHTVLSLTALHLCSSHLVLAADLDLTRLVNLDLAKGDVDSPGGRSVSPCSRELLHLLVRFILVRAAFPLDLLLLFLLIGVVV